MLKKLVVSSAFVLLVLTGMAMAQDRTAVVIAHTQYDEFHDPGDVNAILELVDPIRSAGFDIVVRQNYNASRFYLAGRSVEAASNQGDEVLVILAGHIVNDGRDAYLLASDADNLNAFNIGRHGLSVGAVLDALRDDAGSVVVLVAQPRSKIEPGDNLRIGLGPISVPQGITVFSGHAIELDDLVVDGLLREGLSFRDVRDSAGPSIRTIGYFPKDQAFLDAPALRAAPRFEGVSEAEVQAFLWSRAKQDGSEKAINQFLDRFSRGPGVAEARRMLADLEKSPVELARDAEISLSLTREQRRSIQADLTLLGFDTNGVDGIFGRGSRAAVQRWQASEGYVETGFLDRRQIRALETMARIERARLERLDAEDWRRAERQDNEFSYLAYLETHPNGQYADVARTRLARFEADKELAAWEDARQKNTSAAYEAFLEAHPNGANAAAAKRRLAALQPNVDAQANDRAQAQENRIMANPVARLLAERQLGAAGMKPGKIDGTFDRNTRAAIRRFQTAIGVPVTGFLDSATLARLLAASN